MPKFAVMLIETLTHRVVVEADTETAAMRAAEAFLTETDHHHDYLFVPSGHKATHAVPAAEDTEPDVTAGPDMPLDPAQRHQLEQDAITAAWEAERLSACDDAIALLREIADLERDDDGDVILGTDADGHNDLLSCITAFLVTHDQ